MEDCKSFPKFAGMKCIGWIGIMVMLAFAACTQHSDNLVETRFIASPTIVASPQLQAIDSLMWQRPDSALTVLLNYLNDDSRDVARRVSTDETFDNHYANLLLAELLYKNDYAQTNRTKLLQAVPYFDSITSILNDHPHASWRHGGLEPPSPERNDNLIFLDARAHYINGVGYYERDSVVEACKEYLKTLEVMEGRFEEKELTGKKAIFMTYTYNRLSELFSAQFMAEAAILCCEQSLALSRTTPVSPFSISNALLRLGMQYDKKGEKSLAKNYYEQAIEALPNTHNLIYRDIASIKALCDYQLGEGIEEPLNTLKKVISMVDNESEKLARLLTVGVIFCEDGLYDSALYYLEPVFEKNNDIISKIQAANYLRIIYDSLEDKEKSDECTRFIADYKKSEGENKALVSKLEDIFQIHRTKKQEKQAEEARAKSIRRTIGIIVPIVVVVVLGILVLAKLKSRKLLKKQQEEADKKLGKTKQEHEQEIRFWQAETEKTRKRHEEELESERLAYRTEQEALRKSLKQHEERVKELETKHEHYHSEVVQQELAFSNEPICRKIKDSISDLHLTARSNYGDYYYVKLDKADSVALGEAVARHFPNFRTILRSLLPKIDSKDLLMCYLYLLHLNNQQIAVLQQCHNSTIHRRSEQLQKDLKTNVPLPEFIRNLAYDHV